MELSVAKEKETQRREYNGAGGDGCRFTAPNQLCYFVHFFALFITNFVHNVASSVYYDRKELLDIRTEISHLELDNIFFFNESSAKDILLCPDKAKIPVTNVKKRGRRIGYLVRIR